VHALLVAASGVAGVVAGAVLDPLGQQLADLSRAAEQRDRAERDARRVEQAAAGEPANLSDLADPGTPSAPLVVPELDVDPVPAAASLAGPADEAPPVRHLLPSGRSTGRTVGAALVTGGLWVAAAAHFGSHLLLAPFLVFFGLAVAVSVTDLTHRLVPRYLVYGALALIVPLLVAVSATDHTWHDLAGAAIGGAAAFGVFFLIWFFVPKGMGFGDVRLAGAIGLTVGYLSLLHVYLAFLTGFILGLVLGLVFMVGATTGRKTRIPFAPALAAGAVIATLWGGPMAQHLFHAGT
jgi:leader peptidase (prepilin peptidase)/N-methyltransferase